MLGMSSSALGETDRSNVLKIYNWSDYIDESLLEEFKTWYYEQTGEKVEIVYQLFDINEIMLAKIERGHADYDLVCPSDYIVERMLNLGLVQPISHDFGSTPDYTSNVAPFIDELFGKLNAGVNEDGTKRDARDYAVGYMWGTVGFIYNKKYVKAEEIQSWGGLWNPKFAKMFFLKDAFRDVYSPMLIYLNADRIAAGEVTIEDLMWDTSDESIKAVEDLLLSLRDNVLGWEADFGKDMMTQEMAWISLGWSGDAKWAVDEAKAVNVELDYLVPQEGSNVWFDAWMIPKYAKNVKAASYFINFLCMSENAIRNMDETGYVSVIGTPEVLEAMSERAMEEGTTSTVDASYFFEGQTEVVLDPILYPDRSVIDRCALMHDSGDRTEVLLEMWSRVKGDSARGWMKVLIGVLVVGAIAAAVVVKIRGGKKKKRK